MLTVFVLILRRTAVGFDLTMAFRDASSTMPQRADAPSRGHDIAALKS